MDHHGPPKMDHHDPSNTDPSIKDHNDSSLKEYHNPSKVNRFDLLIEWNRLWVFAADTLTRVVRLM